MITAENESKTLTGHILCKFICKFNRCEYNSNQWWNNNKCQCECKKHHVCEKSCIWNPATCSCENGKYLASIMDNSAITCNEIVEEEIKQLQQILMKEKQFIKQKTLLAFLLIRIALLTAVSIYCYLVKYKAKQKHL